MLEFSIINIINMKYQEAKKDTPNTSSTWDDLWKEFIVDCENSNKKDIEPSDFLFWLDFSFKVPERL